jgi:twitching motility protein PilI
MPPLDAFQARLADRLQAASTENVSAAWLAVEAGAGNYLFPLDHTGEIFPWTVPQPVPHTEPWFLGVANLRGGLHGVVRLSAFTAGERADGTRAEPPGEASAQTRLVALHARLEVNCALMVDRLIGLRAAGTFHASHAPEGDVPAWFGRTHVDGDGERWQELDLQALARHPRFLNIGT